MIGDYAARRLKNLVDREDRLNAWERTLLDQHRLLLARADGLRLGALAESAQRARCLHPSGMQERERRLAERSDLLDTWASQLASWSAAIDHRLAAGLIGVETAGFDEAAQRVARALLEDLGPAQRGTIEVAVRRAFDGLRSQPDSPETFGSPSDPAVGRTSAASPVPSEPVSDTTPAVCEEGSLFVDWPSYATPAPMPSLGHGGPPPEPASDAGRSASEASAASALSDPSTPASEPHNEPSDASQADADLEASAEPFLPALATSPGAAPDVDLGQAVDSEAVTVGPTPDVPTREERSAVEGTGPTEMPESPDECPHEEPPESPDECPHEEPPELDDISETTEPRGIGPVRTGAGSDCADEDLGALEAAVEDLSALVADDEPWDLDDELVPLPPGLSLDEELDDDDLDLPETGGEEPEADPIVEPVSTADDPSSVDSLEVDVHAAEAVSRFLRGDERPAPWPLAAPGPTAPDPASDSPPHESVPAAETGLPVTPHDELASEVSATPEPTAESLVFKPSAGIAELVSTDGVARRQRSREAGVSGALRRSQDHSEPATVRSNEEFAKAKWSAWDRLDAEIPPTVDPAKPANPRQPRAPRASLRVEVGLEHGHQLYTAFSGNVSAGGLFVATNDLLAVGAEVDLTFSLPIADEPPYSISVWAVVQWIRKRPAPGGPPPAGMGLQFKDLCAADLGAVERYIAEHGAILYE